MASLLAALGALAFVLGILVLLPPVARRLRIGVARGPDEERIEVLSRVALAARQGVATVRVRGRVAMISYGDGGVRLVMELTGPGDGAAVPDTEALDGAGASARIPFRRALARAAQTMPALRAIVLALALAWVVPTSTSAQQPGAASPVAAARPTPAAAAIASPASVRLPDVRVSVGAGDANAIELSGPVGTVLFVGFLTLLPALLLLMTSFTRILVVLHLLKQALGTQTAPPAQLLTAMALVLTSFVMAPTLEEANDRALAPWMEGRMDSGTMLREASVPFRSFMLGATREQDLAQFVEMSGKPAPTRVEDVPLVTLTAAFVTSELTSAFQMGFALFLPFLVIDIVVASVLMSMGMFMLPPVMVSLPFKLLLFVLVDGWSLIMGSLVQSFA